MWQQLEETVRISVKFLDSIIDLNKFPDERIKKATLETRKIGLGIMGFADMLIDLKVKYGSKESVDIAKQVMKFITEKAHEYSQTLGLQNTMYPLWKPSTKLPSRRNLTCTTIAPTGSLSIIAGCSSGIEPNFDFAYKKNVFDTTIFEVNQNIRKELGYKGIFNEKTIERIINGDYSMLNHPELFVKASQVSVEEHINVQAAFQQYTDNAVSKCISEDTLLHTNKGVLPIKLLGSATDPDSFGKPLDGLTIIDHTGKEQPVLSHYYGGIKPTIKIRFNNGDIIEISENHKLMTIDGWKKAKDITKEDLIVCKNNCSFAVKGNKELNNSFKFRSNSNVINLPGEMSVDLALWLGMMCADGHTEESTGNVSLTKNNDDVLNKFSELSFNLFNVKPILKIDKRNDVKSLYITSRALSRYVEELIGKRAKNKHIPIEIMIGSVEEQIAFITGITLDGYLKRNRLVIYEGISSTLGNQLFSLCIGLSLNPYLGKKKTVTENITYSVEVDNRIIPIEEHKKIINWKTRPRLVKNVIANEYLLKVTNIEKSTNRVYDIEVKDTHTYTINGIISHNTINCPYSATKEDVRDAILYAYEKGCKGITIYRDRSRNIQVLESCKEPSKETVDTNDKEIIPSSTTSLEQLKMLPAPGFRYTARSGCGTVRVSVFNDDNDKPFEVFVGMGKSGGCASAFMEVVGRLVSTALQEGVHPERLINQLTGISCTQHSWGQGGRVLSCIDSVGGVLKDALLSNNNNNEKTDEIASQFGQCPDCGAPVINKEGCVSCSTCFWSQCS